MIRRLLASFSRTLVDDVLIYFPALPGTTTRPEAFPTVRLRLNPCSTHALESMASR